MHISISRREAALEEWLLLFLFFSAAGWIWEVLLTACATGMWVNRGMLHGPWLPVYGVGGVLITAALGRLRRQWLVLPLGALAGGAVEYGTSLALEFRFRQRWWDYTGQPGSLSSRVCLASLAGFALAGWAAVKLTPALIRRIRRLEGGGRTVLCRGLCLLYALDWSWSLLRPNMGAGISCPL